MTTTTAPVAGAVAPRHHAPVRRPSLLRLTTVELRKLVDTRAGRWLLITIGLVVVAIVTLLLIYGEDAELTFFTLFAPSLLPVSVLLPVLGILSITSEWSQRTALTTYALVPRRERVVAAKLAAVVLAALASVLVTLAVASVGTLVASATGGAGTWPADIGTLALHATIVQVASVLMGAAFGLMLLNTPLAIVGYLLLPTIWTVLGEVVRPLNRPADWLDTSRTMEPLFTSDVTGGQWARLAVSLLVWLVLPLAVGLVRTLRREVS
ncbi:ABC transporter permease [Micromonospora profundi]|uniref:ABC transporter permease n=1 Tax=Micromonospora profundi TaxID=1420889 RepID=A0AAJ6L2Q7_9ACTN|nr:ABC transporter permease [Micromonospora profundi]NJC14450.1 hypothetical protein [Micromonospora profundi]WLS46005.1 ABC transporter permease [Micromonospora profundi]